MGGYINLEILMQKSEFTRRHIKIFKLLTYLKMSCDLLTPTENFSK